MKEVFDQWEKANPAHVPGQAGHSLLSTEESRTLLRALSGDTFSKFKSCISLPRVPEIQLVPFFCRLCKHMQNWTVALLQMLFFCVVSGQITKSRESLHQHLSIGPGYSTAVETAVSQHGFRLGPGKGLGAISASIPSLRKHQLSLPHLVGERFSSFAKIHWETVNLNKAGGTCHFPCTASAGLRLIR